MKNFIFFLVFSLFTSININAQCPEPNSYEYGNGTWNGYVYSSYWGWFDLVFIPFNNYKGYVTEPAIFDRNNGNNVPTGSTGTYLCNAPSDKFAIKYFMKKNFPAGGYIFTFGGDDGYRVRINDENTYAINEWDNQSYNSESIEKNFSTSTNIKFDFEYYEKTGDSRVSFSYCQKPTAPTTLTASSTSQCAGSSVTLTASGGDAPTGSVYVWGTGSTTLGQTTSNTFSVTPMANTTYWVKRVGVAPCNIPTSIKTIAIAVVTPPIAPTGISTSAVSICIGSAATLTANGTSGTYEWGTGSVGSNIIATQTGASITVSPTSTTTYWVRVKGITPCSVSAPASIVINVSSPSGNPEIYGDRKWNVYAFNTVSTPVITNYRGFYIQNTVNLNTQDIGNNGWDKNASPSSSAGWNGCNVPNDYFTTVHKRKGFDCGKYELRLDNWDDNTKVLINGQVVFTYEGWSGDNPTPTLVGTFALNANSTIDIITTEYTGSANVKLSLVEVKSIYNGSTWSIPVEGAAVIVNSGTVNVTENINICSCTLNGTATVVIKEGFTVVINDKLVVGPNASFTVENNASLVQINDTAANSGNIAVKRKTTPVSRYDYTYWSSPLKAESDFLVGRDQANTLRKGLSKTTFYDKYYKFDGQTQAWSVIPYGTEVMVPGKGYIVRAPQEFAITTTPTAIFEANFGGIPNNGIITLPLVIGTTAKSNLIGNPYPSAIDATKFYNENSTVIDGTFYFWTHNIAISSTPDANGIYQYNAASYLAVNAVGGTANGSGIPKASQNIATGQGFFVNTKTAGQVNFNNAMRVKEASSNSNFYRTAIANQTQSDTNTIDTTPIEKNRFWLNITNPAGAYNETLIGYVTGATNNIDDAFDGITYAYGTALYTVQSDQKFVIQGRALPFVNTDIVPLGFTIATAGEYSIGIESLDGLFADQNVYLLDKSDNTYHNIKEARYTFTATAGTFNSRFEIRYVNDSSLDIDTPVVSQNDIVVYKSGNQIAVRANNLTIDNVQVYDITGKLVISGKNINNSIFTTSGLNVATQVLIVKVTLDDNQTVSKKVIMN